MKRSIFAPHGRWKHSAKEPLAKQLHRAARALLGVDKSHFSPEMGTTADVVAFVAASMVARAARKIQRAGEQRFARTVYDLITEQEEEHGIISDPRASIAERRAVLDARAKLPLGSARAPLETGLAALLGDNYVGIHITRPDAPWNELSLWPDALGDQPQNLQLAGVERKLIQIQPSICIALGEPVWVRYTAIDPQFPVEDPTAHTLALHDKLVVEPELLGRTEVVEVLDLDLENPDEFPVQRFRAIFEKAHDKNCFATTSPFPLWISNQRHVIIVVKPGAVLNLATRQQLHEHMRRVAPGVTTWSVVQESDPGMAGPFTLDDPVLGLLDANPTEACPVMYLPPP